MCGLLVARTRCMKSTRNEAEAYKLYAAKWEALYNTASTQRDKAIERLIELSAELKEVREKYQQRLT